MPEADNTDKIHIQKMTDRFWQVNTEDIFLIKPVKAIDRAEAEYTKLNDESE